MAAGSYHFSRLPTYKDAWLSLMETVLTFRGAASQYELGSDQLRHVRQPVYYVWGDSDPFGDLETAQQAQQITSHYFVPSP